MSSSVPSRIPLAGARGSETSVLSGDREGAAVKSFAGRHTRLFTAVLEALRFDNPGTAALRQFSAGEWQELLAFCDRSQLTLLLAHAAGDALPDGIRERLAEDLAKNTLRTARVMEVYSEIARSLEAAGIEFVVLKGFTQWPRFVPDLNLRVQYDLDLAFGKGDAVFAREVLIELGYEPLSSMEEFPTDHLPTMIRKTGWQWRGDYFDPAIPLSVDLHFRFWDADTERVAAAGVEQFWERRRGRGLHPADALGYAALHLLRHLLRGSLKPMHVYELAYFLHRHSDDDAFWDEWRSLHPPELRRLEAIAFRLAAEWFGCRTHPAVAGEIANLTEPVRAWFEHYAMSPLEAQFQPNKSEIWLHLALIESRPDKWRVLRRRVFPMRLPGAVDAIYVPDSERTIGVRLRSGMRYAGYLMNRARYHLGSLIALGRDAAQCRRRREHLDSRYWRFLGACSLYNLGMFVFVVLYNLYLLGRGYRESELGAISSAMTAGSIAGTIAAGVLARRAGLRATIVLAFGLTAVACALRATVTGLQPLMVLAFLNGMAFAGWAVSIPPTIAALTTEKLRSAGFSIFFGTSVALGIAGGWLAGRLPGWFAAARDPRQAALLAGCALAALAVGPASKLRIDSTVDEARVSYPRGRFIAKYLAVFGVWNLATGAFNPFFNAYFSVRHGAATQTIGSVFSAGQAAEVVALCAAPWLLRRWGLTAGVGRMMMATAAALALLAGAGSALTGAFAYMLYLSFQWMSEPGMSTFLMNGVRPEERRGASSLNFLVAFTAQAAAAACAGWLLTKAGYSPVLLGAAALALAAGLSFGRLRAVTNEEPAREPAPSPRSLPEPAPGTVTR